MVAGPVAHDVGVLPDSSGNRDPLCAAESDEHWFALYTRSRQEKQVARACEWHGVRHYLPLRENRTFTSRARSYQVPVFPGYLFACLDPERRQLLLSTGRILKVIVVRAEREFLAELWQIRAVLESGTGLRLVSALRRGDWVRVERGPLAGVEGLVTDLRRRRKCDRLVLNMSILGRGIAVEIDLADVERIHRVADDSRYRDAECPSIGACPGDS